ncbi:hypothetical protein EDB81DRAFT_919086 [Dactylonectria macrodidyma]|uniref:Carrier domain-containing protein n=1 Tax=Dactylonectria macrodidyma TaxID=307937 RepID=A0A9P9JGP7_9HYPO|nr:hypothetical protein EDB81DRAFT_919086 [Dactylonectria macrodidyma]
MAGGYAHNMTDAESKPPPPITQLRPLHSHRQPVQQRLNASPSETRDNVQDDSQLLHWASPLELTIDENTRIKAFVELVSLLVALDPGEAYCIQDSIRGGFILAHSACPGHENNSKDVEELGAFRFIECADIQHIPTDFSLGKGKALQLHFDGESRQARLTARSDVVSEEGLTALGCMLDDITFGLQRGQGKSVQWTQPSVLNFPPKPRPLNLFPKEPSCSGNQKHEDIEGDGNGATLLHQWFEQRVAENPNMTALDFLMDLETGKRIQFTYQQVDNAANALAAKLICTCAQSQSHSESSMKTVAVLIGPCPELYISYLAALKAGMAFCPIPVDAPEERKGALMADLRPAAIVVAASTQPEPSSWSTLIPVIDVAPYLAASDSKSDSQSVLSPISTAEDDVAYILYTSGTTGMPKGVAVSHLSAACTISALSSHYGFVSPMSSHYNDPIRWFQGAAPTFDISLFEIFWTLSTGSTLCCAPRKSTLQDIDRVITTLEADITNITPSFASLLDPSSINGLMVGGETLGTRLLQDFARHNPTVGVRDNRMHKPSGIYNGYGPTEAAIYCIAQAHVPEEQRGSVLGTPLQTCGILIVDELSQAPTRTIGLEPVPMGAIGELVITGPQVSRAGYLNRPDETALAFVDDARWGRAYRTGDRARIVWDPSGEAMIEFLGRISDDQVKLSGRRVELGEIDSVLASRVEGVREALSCVWKQQTSETGSEKVVSLVVLEPRADLDFELVQQRCLEVVKRYLPDYMRPFKLLLAEALPKSASGKVDRKAASAYIREVLNQANDARTQEAAQHETAEHSGPLLGAEDAKLEEELLSIVSSILTDGSATTNMTITATTPLVEAGLDSLRAMRLLRDIRKRWLGSGSAVQQHQHARLQPSLALLLDPGATTRSIFFPSTRTVNGLAKLGAKESDIRNQLADFSSRNMPEALDRLNLTSEADIEMVLPATSTQSQLAMSFTMDRRNYISHSVLDLKPGVSVEALKEAIDMVVSEQAIYRCAMIPSDDSLSPFAQVILTPEAWRGFTNSSSRVVHEKATASRTTGDVKAWLALAEESISLESQILYHVQVVEPASDTKADSSDTGLLVISVAHCICDGASLEVLMSDIARRYAGLKPLGRQGIDEVVLEWASNLDVNTDKLWQESLKDWETESFGALSGNNVKSSAAGADCQHGMVEYASGLSWQVLEDKSRALGASPLSILQASWSLLLQSFSEADTGDVVFGSVISGHHLSAHAPTFSVVPCRVALPESQTLSQLVGSLTSQARFVQSHRHISFGTFKTLPYNTALALQAYSSPDPLPEDGPELTAVLPWTEVRNPAIRYDFAMFAEVFPTDVHTLGRSEQSNMTFKLTYREDTLSNPSATCIVKQLAALTETVVASFPDDMAQGLPARLPKSLLSAEGVIPAPVEENRGRDQQSRNRVELLHSQFENQAAETPDLLALSFYNSLDSPAVELSYAELDARANGLANILREEDVEIIPICMQRSVELYVAVLAILKAGSAWCPIDETSPIQRRTSLIARTQSKVLLTTADSLALVEPCLAHESLKGMRVILVDQYANQKASIRADPRRGVSSSASHDLSGQDLAYLLWTSGTTGEPKGVMIQHTAAAQAMRDLQVQIEHDEKAGQVRTLQLSSYSFDVFVQDLFYTWGLAGAVISGTRELVLGTFVEFIWTCRPTHAHLTPSFGASIDVEEIKGSTLQYVTFIGEKLTEDVAEAWATPGITTRAYNTYGPAENAVVSTLRRFYGTSRDKAKAANVGFPLNHCTSYVVREVETSQGGKKRWELVLRYGVGELALGGAQVGKGYLSNEAKTTKAFIQAGPGIDERIYLTGDMVRLNDHGFEFLGRNDDLVKITGIRIELSEISAACASVKDEEAAVEHVETLHLLRPGADDTGSTNKVVVTFVSVKKKPVDTSKIRAQVFQRAKDLLPAYMVPGHVVVLDTTMPRTASNKVDRKALQEIYKASDLSILAGRDGSTQQEANGEQTKLQWTEKQHPVLQTIADHFKVEVEPLSPEDSLAGLGFSSLQVTKLAWSLRRQLKCHVGVLDLMRCHALGELVDVVLSKLSDQEAILQQSNNTVLPKQPEEISWVASAKELLNKNLRGDLQIDGTSYLLPATPVQESLIVETILEPRAYWAHRVFDLSHLGEIDGHRLQQAWTAAARNFDILRTGFVPLTQLELECAGEHESSVAWARQQGIQSTILQLVQGEPQVCWNLLSCDEGQNLARWAEKLQMELAPKTARPPWAVTFVEGEAKMMLSMHHALYDGVSSEILLDNVTKMYQTQAADNYDRALQFEKGMELGLLPTSSQRDEAASRWKSHLANIRETSGALNGPFPDLTQSRQKQPQRILLSRKSIPSSVITSGSASGSALPSLPILLQSAFGCVLASYLELKAVVFGQTVSQRILHPDLAHIMGPAMATLPVVVQAYTSSAEKLWNDMARDSSDLFRSTHSLHPVDIKKMINEGSGSTNAAFPGLFVYHPAPDSPQDSGQSSNQHMFREVEQALSLNVEHPLALNVFEAEGAMELTGDGRRISQAQLELMLNQILDQARVMLEMPQLPLDQIQNGLSRSLLSISGEATVDEAYAVDPTEMISQHASQHPDWIAAEEAVFEETDKGEDNIVTKTITYAQLDMLVNAIASRLVSYEARLQSDDVVAMYLGRDIKSLAVTLAIFRAGYVYLPIDEDLPPTRKQLLFRDAKAKLVITTNELAGDLDLNLASDPPTLLMPDSDDDVNAILSWPMSQIQPAGGHGGYLLYTSGSTGRPKGVRVSNSNLCHFIAAFSTRMTEASPITANLGGAGKYLNLTSRAFDPHITQLFVPWYLGHRVVIGKNRAAMLGSLQQVINDLSITHFGSVPSVLSQLRLRPEDVPSVKVVTTGGEKASSELLDTWTKRHDSTAQEGQQQVTLFNFYGPTEVTIGCLGHAVNRDSNARNLGLPLQGLEALLLSPATGDEQVIARRGQPGELCIAGPQVAMGYLDRPAENAKSFQTTSLLGRVGKRIYRTGDMMKMMHDGTLEYLGRADGQAKIRGQRLELDEVVCFLKQVSAGEGDLEFAAAVVANGNDNSNQQLLGFVARNARSLLKGELSAEVELLQHQGRALTSLLERIEQKCEVGLPAFMVPTLLWLSRIPYLTASGKVDTKLLTKLGNDFFASQNSQQSQNEPAITPDTDVGRALDITQSVVVAAVEEAVGSKIKASATSNIHRLGIDSLSAVHMVSLLRKRGFAKISIADVLSSSCTVGSIARLADQDSEGDASQNSSFTSATIQQQATDRQQNVKTRSIADLGPVPVELGNLQVEVVLPCLPLQSALVARSLLWLSANSDDGGDRAATDVPYVAQFQYRLSRGTDVARWKKAAELAVASEAMLSTCFVQRDADGSIFQVVLQSPLSPFDNEGDPAAMVAQMNVRPPIRFHIGESDESGETVVSLKIHHALFDGVAIDLLRKKLEQSYHKQPTSTPFNSSLNVLTRVSGYCCLSDAQLESTKHQWQARLRGVRPCRVGADNDNKQHGAMTRSTFCLAYTASQLKAKLRAESQQSGISISVSSAFQLATALCISQLTQQASVVYGFVLSLRPLLDHVADGVDRFVGPCLNTLIQTLSLRGEDETLLELAQRAHDSHLSACEGRMPLVSVEKVQRWAGSDDKLFDSLLSINLVPADVQANSEPEPGRMAALGARSKSDMALAIDVDLHEDDRIILTLSSAGALTETQLHDVGRLFEKIAYSSTDHNTRVGQIVPTANSVTLNSHCDSEDVEQDPCVADEAYHDALTCVQKTICSLLRLKTSDISDQSKMTSLYQIGLDSITVLPFVKLINKSASIRLTPDAVIKARTIQGATRLVQEAMAKTKTTPNGSSKQDVEPRRVSANYRMNDEEKYDTTLERVAKDLMFVATPLQEGMLSASLAIEGDAYTYVHTIELSEQALQRDNPSLDAFFAAVRDTVQACEILRTRFIFTQDDIAPWIGVVSPTEQSDLVSWEAVNSGSPGMIQLKIHHALYDAASMKAIWHILGESYRKRLEGHDHEDEEATRHLFRPFARAVALAQRSSVGFWTKLVQDYRYVPLNFPSESLRASSTFQFVLDEQTLSLLQTRCRELSVTPKAALQLSWVKVLCEDLYGQPDIVYGEVVSTGGGFHGDGDGVIVGPTINTVPMRAKLVDQDTTISVAQALTVVQNLSDDARGAAAMGSLREIQTLWRSSSQDQEHVPATLFQSLFVFDGVITSTDNQSDVSTEPLFRPAQAKAQIVDGVSPGGPAYDDYPVIVNFHIKDNVLHGKLRAKMTRSEVRSLGTRLEDAVRNIISSDLQRPALDLGVMRVVRRKNLALNDRARNGTGTHSKTDNLATTAGAILELVKTVLGTRCEGKDISYNARLVNVGLDSILAIRLSNLLRRRLGISASVFQIIKGASIYDIAKNTPSTQKQVVQEPRQPLSAQDAHLKGLVAARLGLPKDFIKSILPVLAGQRAHLEQWLYNGKRFFEAPWVYQVVDDSLDAERVASSWTELCRIHEVLRTTFVWADNATGLVQVTLGDQWKGEGRFTVLRDLSQPIKTLIDKHVDEENGRPSDFREPPAHLSFLEALDGRAIVLRVHHALYDAWSIKMIERDFNELLATGKVTQASEPLEHVVRQIRDIRQPNAEDSYWKHHLSHAQETILQVGVESAGSSAPTNQSPLGPHFKTRYSAILPQSTMDAIFRTRSNACTSAAIILAYARTLGHFTKCSRPTFGLNHASRSLSSADGAQTLDLTAASLPTLTVTPFSLDLDSQSPNFSSEGHLLDFVQDHLAHLTKFAQSDGVQRFCPKFNTYINIIFSGDNAARVESEDVECATKVLSRYRLQEPLASNYFSITEPSLSTVSTFEDLETSQLWPCRLFLNVIVDRSGNIGAVVTFIGPFAEAYEMNVKCQGHLKHAATATPAEYIGLLSP